ncbi:transposase [Paenibacillus polymyxa]
MKGYQKNSHAVYEIKYHVIWMRKYRYKVLKGPLAIRAEN